MLTVSSKTRRHQELRRLHDAAKADNNLAQFKADFQEALEADGDDIQNRYSIRELFEQFTPDGREAINFLAPKSDGGFVMLRESENIDTSAFANIIGQVMYTSTLQGYTQPGLVGDMLVETIQTQFNGERLPGVGRVGDDMDIVYEGQPYPNAVIGEEWVDTPQTIKRGLILNVTKEAIFFDRTGVLLQECGNVGMRVSVNREKRILDAVCGITTIYSRNGAAAVATYGSDNTATNTLSDWSSIDTAQQKFNVLTDPTTGEPIAVNLAVVLVPKALEITASRVQNASMVRQISNTNTATYVNNNGLYGNAKFDVISGQYVRQRTSSDSTWFAGDPKKAFVYMQNWPLTVTQSTEDSEVGFTRDIVLRFKASERGAPAVRDRRYMVKNT